ncbi:MAG TPA: hypothetical protein VGE83_00630 [Terracidiphilus sp.]|jgi:hypothetical protein
MIKLLNEEHDDAARGQDSPENAGLQIRARKHIDKAREHLQPFMQEAGRHEL